MFTNPCLDCKEGSYDPNCNENCASWDAYIKQQMKVWADDMQKESALVVRGESCGE